MPDINILVVDDEKEIADLIEIYLVSDGYKVFKAENAPGSGNPGEGGDPSGPSGYYDAGDEWTGYVQENPGDQQHSHYYAQRQVHGPG